MKNKFSYTTLAINFFLFLSVRTGIIIIFKIPIIHSPFIGVPIFALIIYLIVMSLKKRESKFLLVINIFFTILNFNGLIGVSMLLIGNFMGFGVGY